ncbi:MAG: flagellar biosynthetic protein FliQ [Rickettsia sp.]|nr:flagellar biosynthetic protein FliQ [Rickettsia sp.]
MDIGTIGAINKEAIHVLLSVSAPPLLVALILGILVSLLQTLTQIQENTLTFVPKIIATLITLVISGEYIFTKMNIFMDHIMNLIVQY